MKFFANKGMNKTEKLKEREEKKREKGEVRNEENKKILESRGKKGRSRSGLVWKIIVEASVSP